MEDFLCVLDTQTKYFESGKMLDCKERIKSLKRLKNNILSYENEIFSALKKDLNKSMEESYMTEIGVALSALNYMIKHIKAFSKVKKVHTTIENLFGKSYLMPSPYGKVLVISPWNYPFLLAIEPMIGAVAAGNSVIVKPSELAPATSEIIKKIVNNSFERGHVDVILGDKEVSSFLLDQNFDYIFYTGSTRVGRIVMEKAAKYFTPFTLELGGKSPCIVDETANITLAAKRIVFGKLLNAGQTCVAPDYILCSKEIYEPLIKEIIEEINKQYSKDILENENYPKIINKAHFDRLINYINKDKVIYGGNSDSSTLKIAPTLVRASIIDLVMQEEIFGPILPIITYDKLCEAKDFIKKFSKPLALYLFSNSKEVQKDIMTNCSFGGGAINDTIMHLASTNLPFGGIKESGTGKYHGKASFDTFTHYKSILKKGNIEVPLRYQPIKSKKFSIIKLFLK